MISATNILDHIKSIGTWVDWDKSLDKVTWGDPHKIISKMMVAWMPSNEVFRQCLDWNADALLTHEAIFNWLVDEAPDSRDETFFAEKLQLLNQSNFTVIRCHCNCYRTNSDYPFITTAQVEKICFDCFGSRRSPAGCYRGSDRSCRP